MRAYTLHALRRCLLMIGLDAVTRSLAAFTSCCWAIICGENPGGALAVADTEGPR